MTTAVPQAVGPSPAVARQSSLRDHNLAGIVRTILGAGGGLSRADVAARTGLTRATVSRLTQDLIDARVIAERATHVGRPGRPATPLFAAARTLGGVGIEVNVDYMAGRTLDLAGTTLAEFKVPGDFADSDPAVVLPALGDLAAGMLEEVRAAGVRIVGANLAIPGLVDAEAAIVLLAPNLGWEDVHAPAMLGERFGAHGLDVTLRNDAKLQGLAAAMPAPGHLAENPTFLYVSGDIGIGSAIIVDGTIAAGQHGWAGEIGHVSIEPSGPRCHCGSFGCLERYAGKQAVLESAYLPLDSPPGTLLRRLEAGDERAHRAIARAGWALGIGIADALNLIDISSVVLGTGLAPLVPWLLPVIRREFETRLLAARFVHISIAGAPEDPSPASTGGALLALDRVVTDPAEWLTEPVELLSAP